METLTVHAFSAGAADAFLLTTEDAALLIDCGEKGFGKEIVRYLEDQGIERLDCLIITHFDKDHVGGAAKVLSEVEVGQVLQSNCPKDSSAYKKYVEALEEAGLEAQTVTQTLRFSLGDAQCVVNPPAGGYEKDESNNSSLIVTVTHGEDRLLFMGDAEDERLTEYLAVHRDSCDFLKVPHHGRSGKLSNALIDTVSPKIAVITSSEEEPEDGDVVSRLEQAGAQVFLTREGAVTIESTGSGVTAKYD